MSWSVPILFCFMTNEAQNVQMYMQIIKITTLGLYVLEGLEEKIIVNTENEIIVIIIIIIIYTII